MASYAAHPSNVITRAQKKRVVLTYKIRPQESSVTIRNERGEVVFEEGERSSWLYYIVPAC